MNMYYVILKEVTLPRSTGQDMENVVNTLWFPYSGDNDDDDLLDEKELLAEFEKMLDGKDNKYTEMAKSDKGEKSETCYFHVWEEVGRGPVSDEPWLNCQKCGISKEEHEKG